MEMIGHGGKEIIERVLAKDAALKRVEELKAAKVKTLDVRLQLATEILDIAYGFFSPLEGFMTKADVESVINNMTLADGKTVWSIPIVYDISSADLEKSGIKQYDEVLLTYTGNPFAIFDITDIFTLDTKEVAMKVYGTTEDKHPGVKRTYQYQDKFLGGKITLLNPPKINEPFTRFWLTPKQMRERFKEKGWEMIINHQTRNVPHTGHEWLMKGAYLGAYGSMMVDKPRGGILVNAMIGSKRPGDYIDEAIILCQEAQGKHGYFRDDIFLTTCTLWDMRYAGPKEAIFHACLRTNLGCTHHMFGRDHAGVGTYYDPYDAHRIFERLPKGSLNITPIFNLDWWFCPVCDEVTYMGLCGHKDKKASFSGTLIRSIIQDGVKPPRRIFRPEVFDMIMECAEKYGFGDAFVTEDYLKNRQPVFTIGPLK
jgi:sulfate adenylyltransferase